MKGFVKTILLPTLATAVLAAAGFAATVIMSDRSAALERIGTLETATKDADSHLRLSEVARDGEYKNLVSQLDALKKTLDEMKATDLRNASAIGDVNKKIDELILRSRAFAGG